MNATKKECVLIVNDVQDIHLPSDDCLAGYAPLMAIKKLIKRFIALGWPIVLVEYAAEGESNYFKENRRRFGLQKVGLSIHPDILGLVMQPGVRYTIVSKEGMNGAREILTAVGRAGFSDDWYMFSGFATGKCISASARGIKVACPNSRVDIMKPACDDPDGNRWSQFPKLPGIHLIDNLSYTDSIDKAFFRDFA